MATHWIKNDWAAATAGAGTVGSPYNSLTDFAFNATVAANDTIKMVADQPDFTEIFADPRKNSSTNWMIDVTIDAGAKTITSVATNFAGGTIGFAANHYIVVQSVSSKNDGIYKIASVTGAGPYVITTTTELREDEIAGGKIRITRTGTGAGNALPWVGNGTSGNPITWDINGNTVDARATLNTATGYEWKPSGANAKKYYLVRTSTDNAAGTNPMFVDAGLLSTGTTRGFITVNGLRYDYSAADTTYPYSSKAASYAAMVNRGWWVGDNDTLGYSTVYVYWDDAALPAIGDINDQVITAPLSYAAVYTSTVAGNFGHVTSSIDGAMVKGGANSVAVTISTDTTNCLELSNVLLAYSGNEGVNSGNGGKIIARNVVTYWTGHRGYTVSTASAAIDADHCVDYGSHILGIISAGLTASIKLRNCIQYHGEAGALDPNATAGVIDEAYNHFAPRLLGGDLNYNASNVQWTTTAATSNPPSLSTDTNTTAQLLNPEFVRVSDYGPELCDFHLAAGSPCIGSGIPNAGNLTDKAGTAYHITAPNKGVYQSVGAGGLGNFGSQLYRRRR